MILVLCDDFDDLDVQTEMVYEKIAYNLNAQSIKQLNPQIFDWLKLQDINVNVIIILMSIELILLAVNINLVSFSIYLQNLTGQVFTMFILTVAAAEAAVGLAIIVIYYKNKGSINVEQISSLKG